MALLVRVLVSAGILFYRRSRVSRLGLERAGRESRGEVGEPVPQLGCVAAFPQFPTLSLIWPWLLRIFLEGSDLGSLCDEDHSLGEERGGHLLESRGTGGRLVHVCHNVTLSMRYWGFQVHVKNDMCLLLCWELRTPKIQNFS